MNYEGSLFFNYKALKDVLVIVIDNSKTPNRVVKSGDVVGLYEDDTLVGVNIFNSNNYLKLRVDGLVHTPNEPLIKLIKDVVSLELKEEVTLVSSLTYLAQVTKKLNNNLYEITLGDKTALSSSLEEVNEGDFVLVSEKGMRLENGDLSTDYMDKKASYLIVANEVNGIEEDLGQNSYALKASK